MRKEEPSGRGGSFLCGLLPPVGRTHTLSIMSVYLNFESFRRSQKPNNYLIAPDGLCRKSTPDAASPLIRKSPEALFRRLVALFESAGGWKSLHYDENAFRISVVAVTPFLRFKDDVDIRVLPVDDLPEGQVGSYVAIYSRSRVGYSDLGANKKRVEGLIARFPS